MLTVEKLRKIANESFEDGDWLCLRSGDVYTITKLYWENDVEDLMKNMVEVESGENGEESCMVIDDSDDTIYIDADHAKDWNYFKNTMGI